MKIKIIFAVLFWTAFTLISCNRDDISFDPASQELRFSRDTVFCDTVFHQVRSETYALKVYNDEDKDINISKIALSRGINSLYRINVDGKSGYEFYNVPLRKKDSLYVFVEIAPQANGPEFIADEKLRFTTAVGEQSVTLFSVVQDAEFFVQTGNTPVQISSNTTWNNDKAKIIYGNLEVAPNVTLDIAKGTKVVFFKNSGMKVKSGATLNVNGDLGQEVIFRGDRSDPKYDTIPKNWNSVAFESGSNLNMNYARVFGGTSGLEMKGTNATIKNTIVHTFQDFGIKAIGSTVTAENLVMNNCGIADFGIFKGGNVTITHSTLANYWNLGGVNSADGLYATNEWKNENGQTEYGGLTLNVRNSIVYNPFNNSIVFKPSSGQTFNYQLQNCLFNHNSADAGFNFDSNMAVINCIKDSDPKFMHYFTEKLNLRVQPDSPAKAKGNPAYIATVPLDIVKISRTSPPTIGAYQ